MEVKRKFFPRGKLAHIILTVGFYDGIHKGHQKILTQLIKDAKSKGGKSCVISFASHPSEYFSGHPLPLLTTWEEKKKVLAELGIDLVFILPFTSSFSSLSPYSFMKQLSNNLEIEEVVIGEDFVFGKDRKGDVGWLKEAENEFGYKLKVIPLLKVEKKKLSSSLIREWLKEGKIEKVSQWLGRYPTILGKVVRGKKRGRALGYPTANLEPHPHKLLPAPGVYAGKLTLRREPYKAIINVGGKPTFGDSSFGIEVHIIKFKGNIYGEPIKIELVDKIRGIEKFASFSSLAERIKKDRKEADRILEGFNCLS
ncbi:MAG: bifunctional riboflavin kinase/FAD synthetase [bacterium]